MVKRHQQLVAIVVAEQNRRMSLRGTIRRDVDASIQFLQGRLRKIDEQIEKLIVTHPKWKVKAELLDSVPGVGLVLISSIIAELPELGSLNRKQVAALVGSTTIVVNQKEEDGYGVVVFIYARCST